MDKELLKDFTKIIRNSTIKRLVTVPKGYEHWKLSSDSLSFAEVAKHLIDIDDWTLSKIKNPALKSIETQTAIMDNCDREKFLELIEELKKTLDKKLEFIDNLEKADLEKKIYDDSFGTEISIAMLFLRRNLDHEIHHRGQIAVYLKMLKDKNNIKL